MRRVVVVGGGLAGLAGALVLARKGVRVTVLEARDENYSRPLHLNMKGLALKRLDRLGMLDEVLGRSGYTAEQVEGIRAQFPPDDQTPEEMMDSSLLARVRISDLEQVLYERVAREGVEFRGHTTGHLHREEDGNYSVISQRGRLEGADFVPEGVPQELGTPDLVLVTDGANSRTREQLGVEFRGESKTTWFVGALVNKPVGPVTTQQVKETSTGFLQHMMVTGHSRYPQSWALIEMEPRAVELPDQERTRYVCRKASELFREQISLEDLAWGGTHLSKVQNRRASQTRLGNVLILGDAARTGFAWSSGGANLALTADLDSLLDLVEGLERGDGEEAFTRFEESVDVASSAWLDHGAREFGRE